MTESERNGGGDHGPAVIGGGPAGLAAAEVLARAGHTVTLYDRMPSVGRKFLIAGRGGLNLTHSEPLPAFLSRYQPEGGALAEAIAAFPPTALRAWCDDLGQPTFVGSSGRVFPEAFKASPLLRAWLQRLDGLGVRIRTRHRFIGWSDAGGPVFEAPTGRVETAHRPVLLALGGASWPRLGSDGTWVPLLARAGIAVAPLKPANVGFTVAWSPVFAEGFAGAPLKRIALSLDGVRVRGEAIISADGIEGGAIYALAHRIRAATERGEARLELDLRPDVDESALARALSDPKPGLSLANRLRKAAALTPVGIGLLREAAHPLPVAAEALAALIKAVPLRLLAPRGLDRAISTAGGVRFDELDAAHMLVRRPGTFVAGEMLDWEAPTGGYLLQGAFASGRAAAAGMLAWMERSAAP
ncbi:NAD(FAD)-utilizing dehydrogenase [Methylobacterium sp. Leaf104]|uniref:TIGR03862 family flavoprotein n=1 Tax=Methylobacterium TaxID=407 RepID=UPI0006FCD4BA|nr:MULTISPECIES: TIGR03862 family flavoprotein [Methylobacterium]KQP30538.1 NAD(FAD)-utilizing dehydrogenase [Methylobacterium sp. Leaf104]MCI9882081.1 TIGR03862 family flavoprotein [Methylobacterium goesingense]